MPGNPLPTDGLVGILTDEQEKLLLEFWREFNKLVDNAPAEGSAELPDGSNQSESGGGDQKDAGKDIPKVRSVHEGLEMALMKQGQDDKAKERMKTEQELKDAKAALEKYGKNRFMATAWRTVQVRRFLRPTRPCADPSRTGRRPVRRTPLPSSQFGSRLTTTSSDFLMLKFLRARKWNVTQGVAMLCAMMKWRMESDVEKIFSLGEEGMKDAEGFIKQMSSGKTYVQGTDREGRPVVYIHVKLHRLMDQSAKALEGPSLSLVVRES